MNDTDKLLPVDNISERVMAIAAEMDTLSARLEDIIEMFDGRVTGDAERTLRRAWRRLLPLMDRIGE